MRVFLIGKRASITHWLEHAANGFRAAGHQVRLGVYRNPTFHPAIDALMVDARFGAPMAGAIAAAVRRFRPEIILAIGAFNAPLPVLERLSALADRPPLVAWVGDVFTRQAAAPAGFFDLVAYTDSGLLARHKEYGFSTKAFWLPHAVDPSITGEPTTGERRGPMAFIAIPTDHRRAVVNALRRPIALYGPGWTASPGIEHAIRAKRVAPSDVRRIYRGSLAALNVRNEANVLVGLNQRSFEPCLAGTPVVSDDQPDLELCFDPGAEVLVWADTDELNAIHERIARDPALAAAVGEAGRRRVLAEHTYGRRLETLARLI